MVLADTSWNKQMEEECREENIFIFFFGVNRAKMVNFSFFFQMLFYLSILNLLLIFVVVRLMVLPIDVMVQRLVEIIV